MTREEAKKLLPIIQAFVEGKKILVKSKRLLDEKDNWLEVSDCSFNIEQLDYRINPEPKYRSFKNAEECWTEMQKHQPFGWVKDKKNEHHRVLITAVGDGTYEMSLNGNAAWSLSGIMDLFTFVDGTPFGVEMKE